LLYVGRVDREKGLDVIVDALASLRRDDVQMVIAGKGSYLQPLKQLCGKLALGDRVVFTGFVPDEDLPLLYNSVAAFVMPSHAELQSIATLEAMSSGLPVLAANARALPELVSPDKNGYLFTPGDVADAAQGIMALANSRQRWELMSAASVAKVRPHSLHNMSQGYISLYHQLSGYIGMSVDVEPQFQIAI
jgi:glycosyltransferase involved in cell wall biosynthesis